MQMVIGVGLSILLAGIAFFWNWITLDATKGVIILGTIVLGFGGWVPAGAVVFFFFASSLITRSKKGKRNHSRKIRDDLIRRDGYQVWANGFWLALFSILWFVTGMHAALVGAITAIATANADTWATEIGMRNPGKTVKITTFREVEPGTDGGVSIKGTMAALAGSTAISLFILFSGLTVPLRFFPVILLVGFLATIFDSILGALFLDKNVQIPVPEDFSSEAETFSNSVINWISTGAGGILAFTLTQIFFA